MSEHGQERSYWQQVVILFFACFIVRHFLNPCAGSDSSGITSPGETLRWFAHVQNDGAPESLYLVSAWETRCPGSWTCHTGSWSINWWVVFCNVLYVCLFLELSNVAEHSKTEGSSPWFPRHLFAGSSWQTGQSKCCEWWSVELRLVKKSQRGWINWHLGPQKLGHVWSVWICLDQTLCSWFHSLQSWALVVFDVFRFSQGLLSLSIWIRTIQFLFLQRWHFWTLDILMPAASIGILGWTYGTVQVWRVRKT